MNKLIILKILIINFILSAPVQACTVCFRGDPNQAANRGLRMGIIAMLGILIFIMILFIKFFKGVSKRSKLLQEEN